MEFAAYNPATGGFDTIPVTPGSEMPAGSSAAAPALSTAAALPLATSRLRPSNAQTPGTTMTDPAAQSVETRIPSSAVRPPSASANLASENLGAKSSSPRSSDSPPSPAPSANHPINDGDERDDEQDWEDSDVEDGIPKSKPGISTWHEHNPDRPVIPLQKRRKQNADTRATAKKRHEANKKVDMSFQEDIDWINTERNKMAEEVAEKHKVKVDVVLHHLMAKSSFKASRKVNLFNAKVHHLAKHVRKMGQNCSFSELKRQVLEDPEFQNLMQAEEAALRAKLLEDHSMTSLTERTGMAGFAFFSKGHVHNTMVPTEVESWDALTFFRDILHLEPRDVGAQFELWAVARDKVDASRKKKIAMNYMSYRKAIVLGAGCILKGYLFEGEPVNLNSINDVESIRKLCNALKSGECFWYQLSQQEKELERLEYEHLIEEGEIQERTRKTRSNKNKPHKKDDKPLSMRSKDTGAKSRWVSGKLPPGMRRPGPPGIRAMESDLERMMDPDAGNDEEDSD
ncbi:hypothetical protein B0H17DRAFT_1152979 [Mycena rosella]|uniref:Uncharacterized protein n=1 Tax=Mycena rosella TaxID=1033263 RepID=A0AAD7B9X5_MYCRO|nr:hypothetical protein B0H17DRAFT_1152979 [Mycena rosella]